MTRRPGPEPAGHRFDLADMVVATAPWTAARAEIKEYVTIVDGARTVRPRAFGLEAEHLDVLRWCQEPRTVAEIAARFGRERPASAPLTGEDALFAAEVDGPRELPLGDVRALLGDLADKGLVRRLDGPDLRDPRLYAVLLEGLRDLGGPDGRGTS